MRKPLRWVLALALVVFFGIVLADSLHLFDDKAYFEVPHGSHSHYVPWDRDTTVAVGEFPTRPPGPGERITPRGQIVPAN